MVIVADNKETVVRISFIFRSVSTCKEQITVNTIPCTKLFLIIVFPPKLPICIEFSIAMLKLLSFEYI